MSRALAKEIIDLVSSTPEASRELLVSDINSILSALKIDMLDKCVDLLEQTITDPEEIIKVITDEIHRIQYPT